MRVGSVRKLDFYRLPRPIQDRFAASSRLTAPPAPLLFRAAPRTTAWASLAGSAVLLLVAGLLLRAGTGDVSSPLALHGVKMLAVDVILISAAAYGIVHAMAILRALDAAPYRPGTYLFPACVVDAREPLLRVRQVGDAEAIEVVSAPAPGLAFRLRDGARVVVPAASLAEAQRAQTAFEAQKGELTRAIAEDNPHLLAEFDPLHDSAMSSPIGPTESMRPVRSPWVRFDWAIAVVLGVSLGLLLGETRNAMSDDGMFRTVTAAGTIDAYREYLAQEGRHSAEVRDVLLPRAELQNAEAAGTVEAIQAFASEHTGSKIGPEIDAAMRRALLAQLDKAKKAGTVAALDDFTRTYASKYPEAKLDGDVKAARHALYLQALAAWKKKAKPDATVDAFVGRLLAWAEKSATPACELRFRLRPSKTLEDADQKVMKSGHFPGPDALPSIYLSVDALRSREKRVAQDLVQTFSASFPSDIVSIRAADALAADAPAPATMPELVIDYSPEYSRSNAVSQKPNTVFANFNFSFDSTFTLPEGGPQYKSSTKLWRGAETWKIKGDTLTREEFQQQVYDAMIDGAFDTLERRLTDALF
jgi:hypothetical protein